MAFLSWAFAQDNTWGITYQQYISWLEAGAGDVSQQASACACTLLLSPPRVVIIAFILSSLLADCQRAVQLHLRQLTTWEALGCQGHKASPQRLPFGELNSDLPAAHLQHRGTILPSDPNYLLMGNKTGKRLG